MKTIKNERRKRKIKSKCNRIKNKETMRCVAHSISFQTLFVQAFKFTVDSWKSCMILIYILWDDWTIFMISGSNEQLQQQLEYTPLKPDCHTWGNAIWTRGRTICKKNYVLNLEKMQQKHMECFRLLFGHLAWIEHQFLSGIRNSRKARSLCGMMSCGRSNEVRKPDSLAKGLELGLLCWGFKGVQEESPSEKVSTLQIGPVTFPSGQSTSPKIHPCHRLFDQDGHQESSSASL